jgi:hypothetical protein
MKERMNYEDDDEDTTVKKSGSVVKSVLLNNRVLDGNQIKKVNININEVKDLDQNKNETVDEQLQKFKNNE